MPCEGGCEVLLAFERGRSYCGRVKNVDGRWVPDRLAVCSARCSARARRADRAAQREVTCEWCGDPFLQTRSDARFCSGRCRVAAHRALNPAVVSLLCPSTPEALPDSFGQGL